MRCLIRLWLSRCLRAHIGAQASRCFISQRSRMSYLIRGFHAVLLALYCFRRCGVSSLCRRFCHFLSLRRICYRLCVSLTHWAFRHAYRGFYDAASWLHFHVLDSRDTSVIQTMFNSVGCPGPCLESVPAVTCDAVCSFFVLISSMGSCTCVSQSRRACLLSRVNLGALALCNSCRRYCFRARGGCATVCLCSYRALH